jgi:hypothetical protein
MTKDYLNKVIKIAEYKYEISEEVLLSFDYELERCYENNFTPIKTVEVIAEHLFN